uniref:Uncharacterized protein n=1 Tax=Oryza brachyantha TaxID=4533 RepID=J3LW46_ORYBR
MAACVGASEVGAGRLGCAGGRERRRMMGAVDAGVRRGRSSGWGHSEEDGGSRRRPVDGGSGIGRFAG